MGQKNDTFKKSSLPIEPTGGAGLSRLKWTLVVLLIAVGMYANLKFNDLAGAVRLAIGIIYFLGVAWIASTTISGEKARVFVKGARNEIRKVVWPTRQETIQTTIIVLLMIFAAAILLWVMDEIFLWLVGFLTGQRG